MSKTTGDTGAREVAAMALRGALHLIAQAGGGLVETYPQDTGGQKTSASFLCNGTRRLFEGWLHLWMTSAGVRQIL
jgi:hypothetical protein